MLKKYFVNLKRFVLLVFCYCLLLYLPSFIGSPIKSYFDMKHDLTDLLYLVWIILPFLVCFISQKKLIKSYNEAIFIIAISFGLLGSLNWILDSWYEYNNNMIETFTPTQEYKKECHNKKNTFIGTFIGNKPGPFGNIDCLSCSIKSVVFSIEEECNRCPNRKWSDFECRLK